MISNDVKRLEDNVLLKIRAQCLLAKASNEKSKR
jgi:hypothetical protein